MWDSEFVYALFDKATANMSGSRLLYTSKGGKVQPADDANPEVTTTFPYDVTQKSQIVLDGAVQKLSDHLPTVKKVWGKEVDLKKMKVGPRLTDEGKDP